MHTWRQDFISTPFISCTDKCHYFSFFQSADAFDTADDLSKKRHPETISALLYIAHALPLACKYEKIMQSIFPDHHLGLRYMHSFHERWPLDGWNDDVIQPARDAVLNYYKVRVSMCPSAVFALNPFDQTRFILSISAMQNHPISKNTCVSIIYPSFYTFFSVSFSRFSIGCFPYCTSSKFTCLSVLNSHWSLRWRQYLTIRMDFSLHDTLQYKPLAALIMTLVASSSTSPLKDKMLGRFHV